MPHVDEDLEDGFRISENDAGVMVMDRVFFCYDLEGDDPVEIFSSALLMTDPIFTGLAHTGANIPDNGEIIVVNGKSLICRNRSLEPWPTHDAIVTCNYMGAEIGIAGFGPKIIEVDTAVEQSETDFDFANLQLAWAARQTIKVPPPIALAAADTIDARSPIWSPKHTLVITREQTEDPDAIGDAYVGWTNSDVVRGYAANTLLMMKIGGRNVGTGIWTTTYMIARDPLGKWKQVVRWKFPDGRYPALTAADVIASKGIVEVTVQGSRPWASLDL